MKCPGSITLAKRLGLTDSSSGYAAEQGTAAHEVLSQCLAPGATCEPMDFIGRTILVGENKYIVDQNMVDALNIACNHVWEALAEAKASGGSITLFIEESMKHTDHELMYGTVDIGIVISYPKKRKVKIWIKDYKHGEGIVVEPTSPQIKYYAVLIADRLIQDRVIESFDDIEEINLSIMQPRIPHPDGLIRDLTMTGPELWDWYVDELVPAMKETENPNAIIQLGEHCTFCPAKSGCSAIGQASVELMTAKPPEKQTGEELGRNIEKIKAVGKLLESYQAAAFKRALSGEKVYNHKLVKQKGNRVWSDAAKGYLEKTFGDAAYSKDLKSPAQIELLPGGKKACAQYAYSPEKGLTLAPSSDKRAEAKPLMEQLMDREESEI
jgi:hypothetical protein